MTKDIFNLLEEKLYQQRDNLFFWYGIFFLFGNLIYYILPKEPAISEAALIFCLLLVCLCLLFRVKNSYLIRVISLIFICFSLSFLICFTKTYFTKTISIKEKLYSKEIEGRVISTKPTPWGMQIILDKVKIEGIVEEYTPKKIRLTAKKSDSSLILIGDKIKTISDLKPIPRNILATGYDFEFIAFFNHIGALGNSKSTIEITNFSDSGINHKINKTRKYIYDILIDRLGEKNGNFASAVFLGETGGIARNILDSMRYAGVSHVLCVSGLHLTIVSSVIFLFFRVLLNLSNWVSYNFDIKIISAYLSLLGSFVYLALTGFQIAATRAFIMVAVFIISIIISRKAHPMRSLLLAAIILLSIHPEYSMHPSFQLSFIAVISLISWYEFYITKPGNSKIYGIFSYIYLYIISNIYTSAIASVATAPLVAYHFYIYSTYSVIANLMIVPIVSIILMPIGIIAILLNKFYISGILFWIVSSSIEIIIKSANFSNNLPYAQILTGVVSNEAIIIYILGFFLICFVSGRTRLTGAILIIVAFILNYSSSKPDMIINREANLIAVSNKETVNFFSKPNKFSREMVQKWYGEKQYKIFGNFKKSQNCLSEGRICTGHGKYDEFFAKKKLEKNIIYYVYFDNELLKEYKKERFLMN